MPIAVGTKAPDFALKTPTGEGLKDLRLGDNFGKRRGLLPHFSLALDGVCTSELTATPKDFTNFAATAAARAK